MGAGAQAGRCRAWHVSLRHFVLQPASGMVDCAAACSGMRWIAVPQKPPPPIMIVLLDVALYVKFVVRWCMFLSTQRELDWVLDDAIQVRAREPLCGAVRYSSGTSFTETKCNKTATWVASCGSDGAQNALQHVYAGRMRARCQPHSRGPSLAVPVIRPTWPPCRLAARARLARRRCCSAHA